MNTQVFNDIEDREAHIARVVAGRDSQPDFADLPDYLRRNPGHTVRDYKGKGPVVPIAAEPREKHWQKLKADEVRATATTQSARDLPRNVRQAAARDPGLIWNPLARKYRLSLPTDPLPPSESLRAAQLRTGAGIKHKRKHRFSTRNTRAHPRP